MRKMLALLCMVVFLFGTALCEETQATLPEDITSEVLEEQVPEELIPEELEEEPSNNSPPPPVEDEELEQPEELDENLVESENSSETPTEVEIGSEEVLTTLAPAPVDEETPEEEEEIASEEIIIPEEIIEIADDDWGHVDEEYLPREVHISFLNEPRYFGDEAVLVVTLINFKPEDEYTICWQYCTNFDVTELEWITIENETERLYSFIVDKENYLYGYRALVQLKEDE